MAHANTDQQKQGTAEAVSAAGFLAGLRDACDAVGALLVFDEVITGFRLCRGGAAEWFGIQPDIWCFGKVIGGGLPVGAFGASREIMSHLAPLGPVYQAGTLSGNPLAMAAGLAQLEQLTPAAYEQLAATAAALQAGMLDAFAEAGVAATVPRIGPLLGLFFGEAAPTDFDSAKDICENGVYERFFHGMLDAGVALAPGAYEALFPSLAHDSDVVAATIDAVRLVAKTL